MDMIEIPVKLIVKAPNQQFEDQTIQCNLSWTIKRLKGYLSEVYPSKPNTEDQRLIYYGQLLNDSVTLKDVFTKYEAGEEIHTVHLVCMPSKENFKMQARKTKEDLNKKEEAASTSTSPSSSSPSSSSSSSASSSPTSSGRTSNYRATPEVNQNPTQVASNSNRLPETNFPQSSGYQQYWMNNAYPQTPQNYNYMQQLAWMQRIYTNYYMTHYMDMIARQNAAVYAGPRQGEVPLNPVPQPRRDDEDDDNRANRDWLDYFYVLSRLLILFSIVYFYSSPARFLLVIVPGVILYLYQVGFFRVNQPHALERNNGVPNNNNNARAQRNNAAHQEEVNEGTSGEDDSENEELLEEVTERPSFGALAWTFLSTFFSSLIPDINNQT